MAVAVEILLAGTGSGVGLLTLAVFDRITVSRTAELTVPLIRMLKLAPSTSVPWVYGEVQAAQVAPLSVLNSGFCTSG